MYELSVTDSQRSFLEDLGRTPGLGRSGAAPATGLVLQRAVQRPRLGPRGSHRTRELVARSVL